MIANTNTNHSQDHMFCETNLGFTIKSQHYFKLKSKLYFLKFEAKFKTLESAYLMHFTTIDHTTFTLCKRNTGKLYHFDSCSDNPHNNT